jgi:hypothetical protein
MGLIKQLLKIIGLISIVSKNKKLKFCSYLLIK